MKIRQEELPGMPPEEPESYESGTERQSRWFYITNTRNTQSLCFSYDCPGWDWRPATLHDPSLALFNDLRAAKDRAASVGGKVKRYPYDPNTQRPW